MTPDTAATVQAWAAVIQAAGAIVALGVAVGVPIYQQQQASKVRIRVTPVLTWWTGQGFQIVSSSPRLDELIQTQGIPLPAFEIVNTSSFAITVSEVGFSEGKPNKSKRARANDVLRVVNKITLPVRLEPYSGIMVYCSDRIMSYSFGTSTRAYAKTESGLFFSGSSPAFDEWCATKPWVDSRSR